MGSRVPTYHHEIDGVFNPHSADGKPPVTARVTPARFSALFKKSRFAAHNLRGAIEVLQDPCAVFQGIRSDGDPIQDGWCYSGRPSLLWHANGNTSSFPTGQVMVVFVTTDLVPYEWGLETEDPNIECAPLGADDGRFSRQTWHRT